MRSIDFTRKLSFHSNKLRKIEDLLMLPDQEPLHSGEIPMSYLMDYALRSKDIKSDHANVEQWPIITDDNLKLQIS